MQRVLQVAIAMFILFFHVYAEGASQQSGQTYSFVDTGVKEFYDNTSVIPKPKKGAPFFGQDAQYQINNPSYSDNGDGTITDNVTGLIWQKGDSGRGMDWEMALKYAENLTLGGHGDWRLPNAKELQSIVDYSRSPQATDSAAIDPVFETTAIKDPEGNKQYPYFWTSTTHLDGRNPYDSAVYIAFGAAQGMMRGRLMDVHGAGAQRSDPKSGRPGEYPQYFGPQGDLRYVFNYVRSVRSVDR
jgi:hypothetical protein